MPNNFTAKVRLLLGRHATSVPRSYNAVTVACTAKCCDAAKETQRRPILVNTLPRLPLPGCSKPDECHCDFREWPDRRIGDRRFTTDSARSESNHPNDRRSRGDRRRT